MTRTLDQIACLSATSAATNHLDHTTAAVRELARLYGFEASEALQILGLEATEEQQVSALRFALHATAEPDAVVPPKARGAARIEQFDQELLTVGIRKSTKPHAF